MQPHQTYCKAIPNSQNVLQQNVHADLLDKYLCDVTF